MSESLDMLKTEEGQLNAVFMCFVSAAQHAQMFEEALTNFLTAYKRVAHFDLSDEEIAAIVQALHEKTLGQLLHQVKGIVTFDDPDYAERMEEARQVRNFLMHRWFLERKRFFKVEEGRFGMLAELSSMETLLDSTRVMANAMRIALCQALAIEDTLLPKDDADDDSELEEPRPDLGVKPTSFWVQLPDAFADKLYKNQGSGKSKNA